MVTLKTAPGNHNDKRRAQTEADVEQYLRERCEALGFMCLKFTSPAKSGVPDRVVIAPASTVFVELKSPGKKPRRLQLIIHEEMRAAGAQVYVIDSFTHVDVLVRHLAGLTRKPPTS